MGTPKASKTDRGRVLDEVMATTGMGRSTARRMLTGPALADPVGQVDGRRLRPRGSSDDAGALLEHAWTLRGMPCGTYPVLMLEVRLPLLAGAGDLTRRSPAGQARVELQTMSAATLGQFDHHRRDTTDVVHNSGPRALLGRAV